MTRLLDKKSGITRTEDLERSLIPSIPFCPSLFRQLRNTLGTILVAYFEIHHPAARDDPGAPVAVSIAEVSRDLQTLGRTLLVPLSVIGMFWPTEEARARGARANREFLNPAHSWHGVTKLYSLTGPKSWRPHVSWLLRRNWPLLRYSLQRAGMLDAATSSMRDHIQNDGGGVSALSLQSLSAQIVNASVLGGDGRRTKAERYRVAGLEGGEVGEKSK